MKISASVYSNNSKSLQDLIKELDSTNIDMFHIDFNDEKIEINKVEQDIIKIREVSSTPIDLHIISKYPSKYDDFLKRNKIEYVTYQYENIEEEFVINPIKQTQYGLAITSNTSIDSFERYKKTCDFVLLMTTTPGESGGKFNKINFRKIREFRNVYSSKTIHVDGGVNDEIAFILRILGVSSVVSGSYLVNNDIAKSLLMLKSSVIHSEVKVKEFMLSKEECPILNDTSNFIDVLNKIEEYKFGFVFIEDSKGKFLGLISMADIRKGLINNYENNKEIKINNIINNSPITINENDNINKMLNSTQNHEFLISFIPVINNENELAGSVTFFNLINSES
ncbi:MAG: CBS domain-containing protein [Bacteroidota bacterium]|nr:CBS domain-containing protein [Bacteroidota bacterium]